MSRPAIREVEFYSDGELIKTITDADTARAIGVYKDVYNKIQSFDISFLPLQPKREGFIREAFIAQSHRLKIVCIKEYLPNVPEILDGARYECGLINKKTKKVETFVGGVPMLYYKLFHGRAK